MAVEPTINELWSSPSLQRLYDTCELGFCLMGLDGVILDANSAMASMLGFDDGELTGRSIFSVTHPDDLAMTQQQFATVAHEAEPHRYEKRYLRKNGDIIWVRIRSSGVTDDDGRVIQRLVMVENVTRERDSMARLERMSAMVEQSDDAIVRIDSDGYVQYWSRGAEQLYGYTAAEAVGREATLLMVDTNDPGLADIMAKLLEGQPVLDSFSVRRHKDGRQLNVSVHLFPITGENGEVEAYGCIHRDVSKLMQLQEQLRHSQRMETAGLLAGGIAHDFNNILTVIQGACSGLSREIPQESAFWPYLDLIERSSDKARSLTRQLLAFGRRQPISRRLVDPVALVKDFLPVLEKTIGARVSLHTEFDCKARVLHDPTQLEQVLLNLCINAGHAMPDGGRILLRLDEVRHDDPRLQPQADFHSVQPLPLSPGRYVRVSVSDHGIGMEDKLMHHIFEPFFTTRPKGEGTGLGLAVVYGVVSQSDGALHVESLPGRGSCFQVFLPLAEAEAQPDELTPPPATATDRGTILLIEDDADVRALIVETLNLAGYELLEAANPLQVLERPPQAPLDLVLTDVVMPGMSGPEFARVWRRQHPQTRFLFISGYFDETRFPADFNRRDLLLKPFRAAELLERVAQQMAAAKAGEVA